MCQRPSSGPCFEDRCLCHTLARRYAHPPSLVRSKVLAAIGKEVKEFYGGNHSQAALTATTGVIVCTIEKANIM